MYFDKHVSETCKASYFHIRALRHIDLPSTEVCKTVAAAIVGSRLEYCNSLLAGTSSNLARLQLVQNTLARVVTQKISFLPHYACSCWHTLASCSSQIKFQACYATITSKYCISNSISLLLSLDICRHDHFDLILPSRKTAMAKSKSFSSIASAIWNKLPCHLSSISALLAFMKRLKHHLFSSAFPGISSSSTDITHCDVTTSTNVNHIRCTLPPS